MPFSVEANIDPEEAFVTSLSSSHMLWLLHLAAEGGYVVEPYADDASGVLGKNTEGKLATTKITLRPHVVSNIPDKELNALHHVAHEQCCIANSVTSDITIVRKAGEGIKI